MKCCICMLMSFWWYCFTPLWLPLKQHHKLLLFTVIIVQKRPQLQTAITFSDRTCLLPAVGIICIAFMPNSGVDTLLWSKCGAIKFFSWFGRSTDGVEVTFMWYLCGFASLTSVFTACKCYLRDHALIQCMVMNIALQPHIESVTELHSSHRSLKASTIFKLQKEKNMLLTNLKKLAIWNGLRQ